jgi:release factor glutamine methyltransferase
MQLREYFHHFIKELKPFYNGDEAHSISHMVFEHFAKADKAEIIKNPHRILENSVQQQLQTALEKLKNNFPVQQVIGHCLFNGLVFEVSPEVLIPRPETEELVQKAINYIAENKMKRVLDIGTGSGCIAISIQHLLKHTLVTAIDVSEEALQIARKNALELDADIELMQLDFLDEKQWAQLGDYDVIISNPPYIPFTEKVAMDKNVTEHEPDLALFVPDNDPLVFYKKTALFALTHLQTGGAIFFETHENYAKDVLEMLQDKGFEGQLMTDFFEKERMIIATRYL